MEGKLSLDIVSVDSTLVDSKEKRWSVRLVEFNGHKGRKGVKFSVAVSQEGLPLSILISPGSEHDSQRFIGVMESIRICIASVEEGLGAGQSN